MNIYFNDDDEFVISLKQYYKNNKFEISEHCQGVGLQTGELNNFYGKRHTNETKLLISQSKKGKSVNKGSKRPWAKNNLKHVKNRAFGKFLITDPSNKTFEVTNLKLFCKQNDLSYTSMSSLANGNYPCEKYKNYKCVKIGYISKVQS